jgi:hypothetical protein
MHLVKLHAPSEFILGEISQRHIQIMYGTFFPQIRQNCSQQDVDLSTGARNRSAEEKLSPLLHLRVASRVISPQPGCQGKHGRRGQCYGRPRGQCYMQTAPGEKVAEVIFFNTSRGAKFDPQVSIWLQGVKLAPRVQVGPQG